MGWRSRNISTFRATLVLLLVAVGWSGSVAADREYAFDLLKKPAYAKAWRQMIGAETRPSWAMKFHLHKNAVSTPGKIVTSRGRRYKTAWICKPHDCGDNQFGAVFSQGDGTTRKGLQAWGVLLVNGNMPKYFGNPSLPLRSILLQLVTN